MARAAGVTNRALTRYFNTIRRRRHTRPVAGWYTRGHRAKLARLHSGAGIPEFSQGHPIRLCRVKPLYRDPRGLLLVAIGGAAGTGVRELCATLMAPGNLAAHPAAAVLGSFTATVLVNLAGAFLLGLVTGLTASTGARGGRQKLLLGTGFCGGFTTYSTFILQATLGYLLADFFPVMLYTLAMFVAGLGAAGFGLWLGERQHRTEGRPVSSRRRSRQQHRTARALRFNHSKRADRSSQHKKKGAAK